MRTTNGLMGRLSMRRPIIQAPMAGGATTPQLVAAVCEAGGFGFVAGAYSTPAQILELCDGVRRLTDKPFGVSLFAPVERPSLQPASLEAALRAIGPYFAELGLDPPALPDKVSEAFDAQFEAVLGTGAAAFSFTMGIPSPAQLQAARDRGMYLIGTATTVEEAVLLERAGVDAVVAQGSEAGAHRGTFAAEFQQAVVGTMALVPQVVDAVGVPVIASGGIMDGRGLAAALALGASAVQFGTAFLTCDESGIPDVYKEAILAAREDETRITRAFSGRPARGIVNRFLSEFDREPDAVLPYPYQNALTRPLRNAAAAHGRPEFLSLWAGQGVRLARREGAAALIARIVREAEAAIDALLSAEAGEPETR